MPDFSLLRRALLLAGLGAPALALAQGQRDSAATASNPGAAADCGAMQPVELCVDFDASRSVDPGAGPLEYRWRFSDGAEQKGLKVTHCFAQRGRYQVVLDVAVPGTDDVRYGQRTFDVDLTTRPVLNFNLNGGATYAARVGEPVRFDALDSVLPACQGVVVVWDFRDGQTQQGRSVQHVFRKPGRFAVRMALRGYGAQGCPDSHCVSQEVVVSR